MLQFQIQELEQFAKKFTIIYKRSFYQFTFVPSYFLLNNRTNDYFVLTYTSESYFSEGLTDKSIVFTNVLVFYRVPPDW